MSAVKALSDAAPYLAPMLMSVDVPWAVAGGWAIDLGVGSQTRPHQDIEIAILRRDQGHIFDMLSSWDTVVMSDGVEIPLPKSKRLDLPLHEIHARGPSGEKLEFLINESEGEDWLYRRNRSVRLPLQNAFVEDGRFNFLATEIVLLFKSKNPIEKDMADFEIGIEIMDKGARAWLADAISRMNPNHAWINRLSAP